MAAPDPGTFRSSSASARTTWARRSRPATSLSATGWACTAHAGGARARVRAELGARTGTDARNVSECLAGQAAGRYACYDHHTRRYSPTAEQAFALTGPDGPVKKPVSYRDVKTGGAACAARLLAELI